MSRVLTVLGDSIARGLVYDSDTARYRICRDTFMEPLKERGWLVRNLSKVGCTVNGAAEQLDKLQESGGEEGVVALELGGNDSDLKWAEVAEHPDVYHEAAVPLEEYNQKLSCLIERVRSAGGEPIVVTPLPVVGDRYMAWVSKGLDADAIKRYLGSGWYVYRWQERYALEAIKVAAKENCPLFDLRSVFLGRNDFDSLMCEDGIHPNTEGHSLISRTVADLADRGLAGLTTL